MNMKQIYEMSNRYYKYVIGVDDNNKLCHCYFLPKGGDKTPDPTECRQRITMTYPSEVFVGVNFEPLLCSHGVRAFFPSCSHRAVFQEKTEQRIPGGICHEFTLKDEKTGLLIILGYEVYDDSPAIRRYTRLINNGSDDIVVNHLSSFVMSNYPYFNRSMDQSDLYLHSFHSQWSFEADPEIKSFEELGVFQSGCRNGFTIENTSTWVCQNYFPYFVIEQRKDKIFTAVQLEYSGSWRFEIGAADLGNDNWFYMQGGIGNDLHAHWNKKLAPGEEFVSPSASLTVAYGSVENAYNQMHLHQERVLIHRSEADVTLPVIYNDWPYMLADVTEQRILEQLDQLQACGVEAYVIDSGWFTDFGTGAPRNSWWDMAGNWEENKERFPHGLSFVAQEISKRGMLPGIWCEIEAVGKYAPAYLDKDMVMTRDGFFVEDAGRHFLNFSSSKTQKFADDTFEKLIADGFRYFKIDYNIDSAPGCNNDGEESLGQGLHRHRMEYYHWLAALRQRHPEVIFENCSSGGMRLEYGMLSISDLASVTDQGDYRLTGGILYHVSKLVHPSQCGMWSWLLDDLTPQQYSFILTNSMMGRMHISGNVVKHPEENQNVLKSAVAFYKQYRHILHHARVMYHTEDFHYYDNDTIRAYELRSSDNKEAVISVARPKGEQSEITIYLNGLTQGEYEISVFPSMEKRQESSSALEKEGIHVKLPTGFSAQIIYLKRL